MTNPVFAVFNPINSIFKRYVHYRVAHHPEEDIKNRIIAINILNILSSFLVFTIGTLYYLVSPKLYIIIPVIIEGILFALLPFLNLAGSPRLTVNATYILHCICACYFGCILGMVVEIQLIVVFLIMASFVVTNSKVDRMLYISSTILALVFMEINYYYELIPSLPLTRDQSFILRWLAILGILSLIICTIIFYKRYIDANLKLKIANEAKSDYVNAVSHDLRTPLNAIIGLTQLLERDFKKNEYLQAYKDLFEDLKTSAFYTKDIVNNVLSLEQIEAGKFHQINNSPFNLRSWAKSLVKMHLITAKKKGVKIKLFINDQLPEVIKGDELKITQAINNFLSNAVKFTKENSSVLVSINSNGEIWTISIKDAGAGISTDNLRQLFEPYNSTSNSLGMEGTGIGLRVSKHIIELLGGKIDIHTKPNIGTEFLINLPLEIGEKAVENVEIDVILYGYKALIIDDDAISRFVIANQLEGMHCEVYQASSKEEGIRMALQHKPHLIFCDKCMPYITDGEATINAIRSIPGTKKTMIYGLTGDAFTESQSTLLRAGANEIITKPVDLQLLKISLSNFKKGYEDI